MDLVSKLKVHTEERIAEMLRTGLMSEEFTDFLKMNMQKYQEMICYYQCAIMEVETKFKVLNEQFSLRYDNNPIESIRSRVKSWDSLLEKLRRKNIPLDIDEIQDKINDIAGVRIVCSFPEDIYTLADSFCRQDDVTVVEVKDYCKNPKPNGYRSLHLIISVPIFLESETRNVKVEVQIRTIAMDFWASLEHKLNYKKDISPEAQADLKAELLECANMSAELDLRMQKIRSNLIP